MIKKSLPIAVALGLACLVLSVILFDRFGIIGEETDGVVRVYYADNISPAHQQIIDRFNELYRWKIEVVPVNLPFEKFSTNERKELFARSLRNKSDRLDIFAVDLIWVSSFSRWAEPLDATFSPRAWTRPETGPGILHVRKCPGCAPHVYRCWPPLL